MRHWFQNLDEDGKLIRFRGSLSGDHTVARGKTYLEYSVCSGFECRLKFQHGEARDDQYSSTLCLGLLFFTIWLTFPLPRSWYPVRKVKASWKGGEDFALVDGRDYGFYFYDWAWVWHWHAKVHESSSRDPWWMRQYIHIDELFLGRREFTERELMSSENVGFRLGGKEFLMNEIKWDERKYFRRFIPFALYHRTHVGVNMKIDKPPMRSGKGENSWDCGDDGCFGMSRPWPHPKPSYMDRVNAERMAVTAYVESILKDAKRYGGSSGERGIRSDDKFEFIGRPPPPPSGPDSQGVSMAVQ